jgi:hypothetical protein
VLHEIEVEYVNIDATGNGMHLEELMAMKRKTYEFDAQK